MRDAEFPVSPELHASVDLARGRRQDLDNEQWRLFDAARSGVGRIADDEEVGFEHIVPSQNDIQRRVEDFAEPSRVEIVLELPLQPPGDSLVDQARGGIHEQLAIDELVALAVAVPCHDVRVVEFPVESVGHTTSLHDGS